jgi:hypothetical protein
MIRIAVEFGFTPASRMRLPSVETFAGFSLVMGLS